MGSVQKWLTIEHQSYLTQHHHESKCSFSKFSLKDALGIISGNLLIPIFAEDKLRKNMFLYAKWQHNSFLFIEEYAEKFEKKNIPIQFFFLT